ncbi:hypothetical protein CERSUDRAFT_121394 [Gelatoporia subvermispora B]|uniref:Uncharacterized protein n=1 Tax=Ceriporiopsis subvermispora (strain B) TaxID=914234 RepID=M2PVC1_CERS8|nr:hypothetical protein CERSUDRAFT_121394 [Gelatoporia subvermispora B]
MSFTTYPPGKNLRDIHNLFPYIEDDVVAAVLDHTLAGNELYKLDSRRILDFGWSVIDAELDDSSISSTATDMYMALDALVVPLNVYFSILTVYGISRGQSSALPCYFFRYNSHLVKLANQYKWHAVLAYHLAFFARRCGEMRSGDYTGWAGTEGDLMEELLLPHRLSTKPIQAGRKDVRR